MRKLLVLVLLTITLYSCSKESDSPVTTEPSNTIFTQNGIIDSIQLNSIGNSAITKNFFSSPYDFTALDSITVQFNYTKSGSEATPVSIVYLESAIPNTLYDQIDTLRMLHTTIVSARIPSPKKTVTLGYTIRAMKLISDSSFASIKLSNVGIYRKNP